MVDKKRELYVPKEGPPRSGRPNPKIFAAMGEDNILLMIRDLYQELEKSSIRDLFPEDMEEASKRSGDFFVFLLGGPPRYQEKHGPPMMRKRHLSFEIDEEARQVWLGCFKRVLENAPKKYQFPKEYVDEFWKFLEEFSAWMVNTKREGTYTERDS